MPTALREIRHVNTANIVFFSRLVSFCSLFMTFTLKFWAISMLLSLRSSVGCWELSIITLNASCNSLSVKENKVFFWSPVRQAFAQRKIAEEAMVLPDWLMILWKPLLFMTSFFKLSWWRCISMQDVKCLVHVKYHWGVDLRYIVLCHVLEHLRDALATKDSHCHSQSMSHLCDIPAQLERTLLAGSDHSYSQR